MSRLTTSFVLGYHGCSREVRDAAVNGATSILQSDKKYDWLGPGAYFWESDPRRALEWAEQKSLKGDIVEPAVVGAVIDLKNCLDLTVRENIELVKAAHTSFVEYQTKGGLKIPENKSIPGQPDLDRTLRFLDRAVIFHLHQRIEAANNNGGSVEPYDTVRGVFTEGADVYKGCGFKERTHTQIAVRNDKCILGLFRVTRDAQAILCCIATAASRSRRPSPTARTPYAAA